MSNAGVDADLFHNNAKIDACEISMLVHETLERIQQLPEGADYQSRELLVSAGAFLAGAF